MPCLLPCFDCPLGGRFGQGDWAAVRGLPETRRDKGNPYIDDQAGRRLEVRIQHVVLSW